MRAVFFFDRFLYRKSASNAEVLWVSYLRISICAIIVNIVI
mgnify:CR=1 FL=1